MMAHVCMTLLCVMVSHIVSMVKMKRIVSTSVLTMSSAVHLTAIIEISALAHQIIFSACQVVVYLYRNYVTKLYTVLMLRMTTNMCVSEARTNWPPFNNFRHKQPH